MLSEALVLLLEGVLRIWLKSGARRGLVARGRDGLGARAPAGRVSGVGRRAWPLHVLAAGRLVARRFAISAGKRCLLRHNRLGDQFLVIRGRLLHGIGRNLHAGPGVPVSELALGNADVIGSAVRLCICALGFTARRRTDAVLEGLIGLL